MNKRRNYLLVLLLIGLIYISCDKLVDYPPSANPTVSVSPNVTTSMSWLYGGIASPIISYRHDTIHIYGYHDTVESGVGTVSWAITLNFHAKTTGTYLLSNKNRGEYFIEANAVPRYYFTDSVHAGTVILTELDTINHVASGTFSFACEMQNPNVNGGLDSVKNGYFTYLKW
jgi:hypothetical protein